VGVLKMSKFILMSDMHLRFDRPVCRTDDYVQAQTNKLQFVKDYMWKNDIGYILHGGDLFDYWKPSPELITYAMSNIIHESLISVAGQHDLPQHSMDLIKKSGIGTLKESGYVSFYSGHDVHIIEVNFGETVPTCIERTKEPHILIIHKFLWDTKTPFSDAQSNAEAFLRKHDCFDLILSGDNHTPFVLQDGHRLLVNPGSMMRMESSQKDYEPGFYVWDSETFEIEFCAFPIDKNAVTDIHIITKEQKDQRIEEFTNKLQYNFEGNLSFEKNMQSFLAANPQDANITNNINKIMGA
jgi:DNA repair exonuclease SbcCD nuclease subunit